MTKLIIILIALSLSGIVGAFCWPYSINTWLVYFHHAPKLVWWQGAILGYVPFLGQASIPVAAATWILMLFIA